jgi:hypothetical protein
LEIQLTTLDFARVYESKGIGGYDLKSPHDQVFAFDYDHSGKLDHLLLYRPGTGTLSILKNTGGTFTPISLNIAPGSGLDTHDPPSAANQVFAFDYDHSGKLDHLVLYRPGTGTISILKNTSGAFTSVYTGGGMGGYDLKSPNDRAFAFDYDHTGSWIISCCTGPVPVFYGFSRTRVESLPRYPKASALGGMISSPGMIGPLPGTRITHQNGVRAGIFLDGTGPGANDADSITHYKQNALSVDQAKLPLDLVVIANWTPHPSRNLPESDPDTLTGFLHWYETRHN